MKKNLKELADLIENGIHINTENVRPGVEEELIDEKMDELIGKGDYTVRYSKEQNRFIVSFRNGDIETSCEMADEVVNYVNIEKNRLRVGNCGESMFWLTWID